MQKPPGLMSSMNITDAPYIPYLNTGSIMDLMTGQFVAGLNGSTILDGGLAMTNGFMGRPQVFKSTNANGQMINAMARYKYSEGRLFDSEFSLKDKRRITNMSDRFLDDPTAREAHIKELDEFLTITNPTVHDLESFWEEVKQMARNKMAAKDSYTVETPFLDPYTGKARRMLIPTFVNFDSWSKAKITAAAEMLDKHNASDSATNTAFMREGLGKNKIMGQIAPLAAKAGIYFIFTAHVGNKIEMNPFAPPSKDIQYMKQGDSLKGVGSDFLFLLSNLFEIRSAKVLTDSSKECEYPFPSGFTEAHEMSSVTMVMTRCKNNNSGAQFSPVVSQSRGYEAQLTNYHYLRENSYFGLGSNKVNPRPCLTPDTSFTRKSAAGKLMDYRIGRAVEILAQLCYVQNNWSIQDCPVPLAIKPEELAEKMTKTDYGMDDILNSRGWWTYDKDEPRPYLTLWDILAIATNQYKPKLVSVPDLRNIVPLKKAA